MTFGNSTCKDHKGINLVCSYSAVCVLGCVDHENESKGKKDTQKSLCRIGKHIFVEDVPRYTILSDLDSQYVACGLKLSSKMDITLDICTSRKET